MELWNTPSIIAGKIVHVTLHPQQHILMECDNDGMTPIDSVN